MNAIRMIESNPMRRKSLVQYSRCLIAALCLVCDPVMRATAATPDDAVYTRKWTRAELEETLKISKEWLGNTLGKDEVAPPPWTPMTVSGQSIGCWGKLYRYKNTILPVSMRSQEIELLSDKPTIRVKSRGRWLEFGKAEVSVERKHDGLVRVKTISRVGTFTLELNTGYEFDGMGKVHMRLSSTDGGSAEGLLLEIPLQARHSVLFNWTGSRTGINVDGQLIRGAAYPPMSDSGPVKTEGIKLDAFREIIWLGDREVGFCWFADSIAGWPIRDETDIQEITSETENGRSLRIKFADKSFSLAKPLELIFGIQTTPMRPRPADFRTRVGWKNRTNDCPNLQRVRWGDGYYYPFQDTYPEQARADVEAVRSQGREIMPVSSVEYFGMYRFSKNGYGPVSDPGLMQREVMFWKEQWDQMRRVKESPEEALAKKKRALYRQENRLPGGHAVEELLALPRHTAEGNDWSDIQWKPDSYPERFCYNSSFQDYHVWKLAELVKRTGLSAIYLDQQLYACTNPDHGCGYIDYKGEWAGQGNVFAMREMAKRIYIIFSQLNGWEPRIMWHCSQQMVIPAMSFISIYYDGEKYTSPNHARSIVGNEFYSRFLTEEVLQVQHMGKPFGFIADFLPQITSVAARGLPITSPTMATTRDLMGLLMIHDSHIDGQTYYPALVNRIINARLSFPLNKMKVAYYWETDSGVTTAPGTIKSILHYNNQKALLVLFNWGDETVLAEADIDPEQLGVAIGGMRVTDVLTGETLETRGHTLKVDLLPRDFRMFEVNW